MLPVEEVDGTGAVCGGGLGVFFKPEILDLLNEGLGCSSGVWVDLNDEHPHLAELLAGTFKEIILRTFDVDFAQIDRFITKALDDEGVQTLGRHLDWLPWSLSAAIETVSGAAQPKSDRNLTVFLVSGCMKQCTAGEPEVPVNVEV